MSNIKQVEIVADVAFDYLATGNLPDAEAAIIGSVLLTPSAGLEYEYTALGYVPNDTNGQTAMYRLEIFGREAHAVALLRRLAMALKASGPLAKLHVAEFRDWEEDERQGTEHWEHMVDKAELSGEWESRVT